jgi:hypothetical protein
MKLRASILASIAVLALITIVVCAVRFVASAPPVAADASAVQPHVAAIDGGADTAKKPGELLTDGGDTKTDRESVDPSKVRPKLPIDDAPAIHAPPSNKPVKKSAVDDASRAPLRIAGPIRGLLVREAGPWTQDTLPQPNTVMIDVVPKGRPRESLRARITPRPDANGAFTLEFETDDLTEGEHEITLSALGSWRWAPVSAHVTPPASGITFTRYDKDPRVTLEFKVSDAITGDSIAPFQTRNIQLTPSADNGVFLQTGPLDVNAFPIDGRFRWSLWADGYAPAFGDETAFVRIGDKRIADVRLARGWSTQVLVLARDPQARQAAGARILVDGHVAGTTGADGMLVVSAPSAPQSLQVELAGWHVESDPLKPFEGKTAAQRGQITIVMMEK